MERRWASTSIRCRLPPHGDPAAVGRELLAQRRCTGVPHGGGSGQPEAREEAVGVAVGVGGRGDAGGCPSPPPSVDGRLHQRVCVAVTPVLRRHDEEGGVHHGLDRQRRDRRAPQLHRRDDAAAALDDEQPLVGLRGEVGQGQLGVAHLGVEGAVVGGLRAVEIEELCGVRAASASRMCAAGRGMASSCSVSHPRAVGQVRH